MSIDTGKSRRGRPRVDSEDVSARMERGMLDAVDAWIAAQPEPRPGRSEAIRRLVAEALGMPAAVKGVAPPSDAFLRALEMSEAKTEARKSRGHRSAAGRACGSGRAGNEKRDAEPADNEDRAAPVQRPEQTD
jgi:hypothetical protein